MTGAGRPDGGDPLAQRARLVCASRLDRPVIALERPGRRRRPTFRARLPDGWVIVSRRDDPRRAALEAGVLAELGARGAPCPRMLHFDGEWLIQEDLGRRRLAQALVGEAPETVERWLDRSIASLTRLHRAARSLGLERRVAAIGDRPGWTSNLLRAPDRLGRKIGAPAPSLPHDDLDRLLRSDHGTFIKWDARPGNAIATDSGEVMWFDWEHCGRREPLDDLAWLLGDDYVPDLPDTEDRLIARHLESVARPGSKDAPYEYLMAFGALHMCIRLNLIVDNKAGLPWLAMEECLADDKVGVAFACFEALTKRATRWASRSASTEALAPWLSSLPSRLAPEGPSREAA